MNKYGPIVKEDDFRRAFVTMASNFVEQNLVNFFLIYYYKCKFIFFSLKIKNLNFLMYVLQKNLESAILKMKNQAK